MAFIRYLPQEQIPEAEGVPDHDNIIQIHGVHGRVKLDYVLKLTHRPIHDICAIAAYFAFFNRIADGLSVELES